MDVAANPLESQGGFETSENISVLVRDAAEGVSLQFDHSHLETNKMMEDYYSSGCHSSFLAILPKGGCFAGDLGSTNTITLLGDSKAAQWFYALDMFATRHSWKLQSFTKAGCPPIPVAFFYPRSADGAYRACDEWRRLALLRLGEEAPRAALLSFSHSYFHRARRALREPEWRAGLLDALAEILRAGTRPALLLDTPFPDFDVPACLSDAAAHGGGVRDCAARRDGSLNAAARAGLASAAVELGVPVIDPSDWFCVPDAAPAPAAAASPASGDPAAAEDAAGVCPAVVGGVLVYRDTIHASVPYTRMVAGRLAAALAAALRL